MKIRNRIAIQFTLIVAFILLIFSALVYIVSSNYREEEFYDRLKSKARTTCQFLTKVSEVNTDLLKIIDNNTLTALNHENVLVFNTRNEIIYAAPDSTSLRYDHRFLNRVRNLEELEISQRGRQVIGLLYKEGNEPLLVLASAYDQYGYNKLANLRNTLGWSLLIGIGITVLLSFYFAGNSLKPISDINQQVTSITASNLKQRLPEADSPDEIGQLAANFNNVLEKLELAFDQQRSFIYHASHELRTPLAALKSEIQLAQTDRNLPSETGEIFRNLAHDTERLIGITNSLLFLARSFDDLGQIEMSVLHIEEITYLAREELLLTHPGYGVSISRTSAPAVDSHTQIRGNEELLKRLFLNLMDNACKYSANHRAELSIASNHSYCLISVQDNGIGIPTEEIPHIFDPFYRASNATGQRGSGIGLSICQRIARAHHGRLSVVSSLGKGSTFLLKLPHL